MYTNREPLRIVRENVMLVVSDYNAILDALGPPTSPARRLFTEHLRCIQKRLQPGLDRISWKKKGIKVRMIAAFSFILRSVCVEEYITKNCRFMQQLHAVFRLFNTFDSSKNTLFDRFEIKKQNSSNRHKSDFSR